MSLTRKQILDVPIIVKGVETPEWGGITYIRMIPLKERFALSDTETEEKAKAVDKTIIGKFIIRYCLAAICDEKGNRLFLNEDEDVLSEKESSVILRIYEEAKDLNGENIEDTAKNSETTQSEDLDLD